MSRKCNTKEEFKRREPAEAFARSVIDTIQNELKLLLRDRKEITALGEEEAKQAVGIFVAASLPRLMRFGKEDRRMKQLLQIAEARKFRAIIQGQAENGHTF